MIWWRGWRKKRKETSVLGSRANVSESPLKGKKKHFFYFSFPPSCPDHWWSTPKEAVIIQHRLSSDQVEECLFHGFCVGSHVLSNAEQSRNYNGITWLSCGISFIMDTKWRWFCRSHLTTHCMRRSSGSRSIQHNFFFWNCTQLNCNFLLQTGFFEPCELRSDQLQPFDKFRSIFNESHYTFPAKSLIMFSFGCIQRSLCHQNWILPLWQNLASEQMHFYPKIYHLHLLK